MPRAGAGYVNELSIFTGGGSHNAGSEDRDDRASQRELKFEARSRRPTYDQVRKDSKPACG